MLKTCKIMLASTLLLSLTSAMALSSDRYKIKQNVEISPDLSAPWVLQLRNGPRALKQRGVSTGLPAVGVDIRGSQQQDFGIVRNEPTQRTLLDPIEQNVALVVPRQITKQQSSEIDPMFLPQQVSYDGNEKPGTIVIETSERMLYLVEGNGQARRYGVGVGKPGFEWAGRHKVSRKAEWPDWRPPAEMISRVRRTEGRILPVYMAGGPENPLGARAMYLGNSLYRIHGTNQPWTIGKNVSSGCIRMRNEDVTDLYERVGVGTQVIVR
jgi:lipoprotein-anchoring transpeptidase ErfK/SrfK